ncbi:MAG: zinc ribbon domain-containing protein [Anaerolineae bacterium]|nr:zinc ribbon domain-containing protein [Anaerolineae bacterium]
MPFYDFCCQQCGHPFTVRASFEEKDAGLHPECPVCQARETQQVLTAGIFIGQAAAGNDRSSPPMGPGCGCGPGGCCG